MLLLLLLPRTSWASIVGGRPTDRLLRHLGCGGSGGRRGRANRGAVEPQLLRMVVEVGDGGVDASSMATAPTVVVRPSPVAAASPLVSRGRRVAVRVEPPRRLESGVFFVIITVAGAVAPVCAEGRALL